MTSTIDYAGLDHFVDLHLSFRPLNSSFTHEQQEQYFRAIYEVIPEAARDLWCAEESLEYFEPPYDWHTEPDPVKEFWRLRSVILGSSWTDEEKSNMDDPGLSLFVRRHSEVNALEEKCGALGFGLDYRDYRHTLAETWDTLGEYVQVLWRSDATGMIDAPLTPITDPVKLWAECGHEIYGEDAREGYDDYGEKKIMFEALGLHVKNYWILKAFEEGKPRLGAGPLDISGNGATDASLAMPKPMHPIPTPSLLLTPSHHQPHHIDPNHTREPSQDESQRRAILAWYFSYGCPVACPCGRTFRETAALRAHRRQKRCLKKIVEEPTTEYRWECPAVVRGVRCTFGNTRVQFMMRHLRREHGVVYPPR